MLAARFCLPPHYVSAPRALTMDLLLCLGRGVGGGGGQPDSHLSPSSSRAQESASWSSQAGRGGVGLLPPDLRRNER